MIIPYTSLSASALRALVEEFITREGTEYGAAYSLEEKVAQVMRQLACGEAKITYDSDSETVTLRAEAT